MKKIRKVSGFLAIVFMIISVCLVLMDLFL